MSLELRVLSGARTGQRAHYDQPVISIGRHPQSDLRFDPESDRDVSARHAEIKQVGTRWVLTDAQSTNGTFVNGTRIAGDHELRDGDVVWFGVDGPRVEVHLPRKRASSDDVAATRVSLGSHGTAPRAVPSTPKAQNTTERIAIAVRKQTRGLQIAIGMLAVLLVAGAAGGFWFTSRQSAEVRRVVASSDSVMREAMKVRGQLAELDSIIGSERANIEKLKAQIDAGGPNSEAAKVELERSVARTRNLVTAGQINYTAIQQASGRAVVLIFVEEPDGNTFSGTGFSVSREGVIVTNRHLVLDKEGRTPKRIAVMFANTKEALPAKVVRTAQEGTDLAVLQITEAGSYPVVRSVAQSRMGVEAGAPIAIIGFPLGIETPMDGNPESFTARATLGAGILSKSLENVLQIDAFAGQGSSGSPVFDSSGSVIGVVYGGAAESGGRIVYAVPLERVLAEIRAAGVN